MAQTFLRHPEVRAVRRASKDGGRTVALRGSALRASHLRVTVRAGPGSKDIKDANGRDKPGHDEFN
jgi:hypothetical protein